MVSFPLIRVKWSNEHFMTGVFIALFLYLLPQWIKNPLGIVNFLVLLGSGLLIDLLVNFFRYQRPVCAVSAAVTAVLLDVLTPGISLGMKLLGVLVALLIGKHLFGGTGKNVFNPAITGLLFLSFLVPLKFPPFLVSVLLIPAFLFSIPFAKFRPFAASGFIVGMLTSLLLYQGLTLANLTAYGVIFWGCLVITDPVTITSHPLIGLLLSFLIGFIPIYYFDSMTALTLGILIANLVSFLIDRFYPLSPIRSKLSFPQQKIVPCAKPEKLVIDLTGEEPIKIAPVVDLSKDEILKRVQANQVFGFGGAAFPTYAKLQAVMESAAEKKHLIVNGVECDPGLIHDQWLLSEFSQEIYQGIQLLGQCIPFASVTIAAQKVDGLDYPPDIKLFQVADLYPLGAEKILIKELWQKEISEQTITAAAGILVLNVQTVFSIYRAAYLNQPADSRYLTVADLKEKIAQIVRVKLGSNIYEVMQKVFPSFGTVFCGGGLMQAHIAGDEEIIDQTVNFLAVGDIPRYKESIICSRCGFCEIYCPVGIRVRKIAQSVDEGKLPQVVKMAAEKCLNCGSCSFICLAGRNLSSRLKKAKKHAKDLD